MDKPPRRRITLTHWLLIVVIAALVANAVLQTISIMQQGKRAGIAARKLAESLLQEAKEADQRIETERQELRRREESLRRFQLERVNRKQQRSPKQSDEPHAK